MSTSEFAPSDSSESEETMSVSRVDTESLGDSTQSEAAGEAQSEAAGDTHSEHESVHTLRGRSAIGGSSPAPPRTQRDTPVDNPPNRSVLERRVATKLRALSSSLVHVIRVAAAFSKEADAADLARSSDNFVRSVEYAPCDAAILRLNHGLQNLPAHPTDRLFTVLSNEAIMRRKLVALIDFKSFAWSTEMGSFRGARETEGVRKLVKGAIWLRDVQQEKCEAIIVTSIADPDWIAVIPAAYFRPQRKEQVFGRCHPSVAQLSPFPPALSPFVMHGRTNLATAIDNIAARCADANIQLGNPYTGQTYNTQKPPRISTLDSLIPEDPSEWQIRQRFWEIFNDHPTHGISMRIPLLSPLTADIRLDHSQTGVQTFIEVKRQSMRIETLPNGQQRMHHSAFTFGRGSAIFTFRAPWDWLLSFVDDDKAYLIRKDDVPFSFWHRIPQEGIWLSHDFADNQFLGDRLVDFSNRDLEVAQRISSILKGPNSSPHDPPRRSNLTANDIINRAGPARFEGYISGIKTGNNDDENPIAEVSGEDDDSDDDQLNPQRLNYLKAQRGKRVLLTGAREVGREAQLLTMIMTQCRLSGKGCVLDLGKNHPFGSIGFVRYTWSDVDKDEYDRFGHPPCWPGKLGNDIPMLTLQTEYNQWRKGYAPTEGTPGEFDACATAAPCLILCTNLSRETAHLQVRRWLVPSEFMPDAHVGRLKVSISTKEGRKAPLFLKNQMTIDRLSVADTSIAQVLNEFMLGKQSLQIGFGKVDVNPNRYLKLVKDYKRIGLANFERCCAGFKAQVEE